MPTSARIFRSGPGKWLVDSLGFTSVTAWCDRTWWVGRHSVGRYRLVHIGPIAVRWSR